MPDEPDKEDTVGNWDTNLVPGEIKAMYKEEHLCLGCYVEPICKVAAAIDDEMLTVISRCAMYLDPGG